MSEAAVPPPKPRSDLGVRTLSGVVMVGVAAFFLWQGGMPLQIFVAVVALGMLFEWWGLVAKITSRIGGRIAWMAFGIVYIGTAAYLLPVLVNEYAYGSTYGFNFFESIAAVIIFGVIATDTGAYIVGRTIGGPKIAQSISPSKTWSGLIGGLMFAGLALTALDHYHIVRREEIHGGAWQVNWISNLIMGAIIATVAQVGDFFESWMKRRAGVKDSGNLIPGHGGLLDRIDGYLAVFFVLGAIISVGAVLSRV